MFGESPIEKVVVCHFFSLHLSQVCELSLNIETQVSMKVNKRLGLCPSSDPTDPPSPLRKCTKVQEGETLTLGLPYTSEGGLQKCTKVYSTESTLGLYSTEGGGPYSSCRTTLSCIMGP